MFDWKFLPREFRKNEGKAFEYIFQMLYPRLCVFANQYLEDSQASEDVVSDIMFELWNKKRSFENLESIKAFLFISVKNRALTYLRKQKVCLKNAEEIKYISSEEFFKEHIIEDELSGIISRTLEKLPEKARRVFELSCIEGLKYKEVAEDLNVSINTVKSQRARAIQLLKELLKNEIIFGIIFLLFQ
ncbi:MAG: RNA polymerase sigma-70 factor [Bacteroidales bacterium]|nr:RNA polymerase sigma-70 factor [Bacteroidales bacterium]